MKKVTGVDINEEGYLILPMIPLRGLTIFPNMVMHFDIGREKSIHALEKAMIKNQHIFLASQKDENTDLPTTEDFYHTGTIARIKQMLKLPGGAVALAGQRVVRLQALRLLLTAPRSRSGRAAARRPDHTR